MSFVVALAGKGGAGKTTVAALLVRQLKERGLGPVLAVDADANYNLGEALGMKVPGTIAHMTDDFFKDRINLPPGMSKTAYLEMQLNSLIAEGAGIDMLVMGHPEGPGCYCYVNNMLKSHIDTLVGNYPFTVIDNEAGMEHLSRRTTRNVDVLLAVADSSHKAVQAAGRIRTLAKDMEIGVGRCCLVVTRTRGELDTGLASLIDRLGLDLVGIIPEDPAVLDLDIRGEPLMNLPADSPAYVAVGRVLDRVLEDARPASGQKSRAS